MPLPDIVAPGLDVLFCGINPGLLSEATGHHFARPGNRFWPCLHRAGFTPRLLRPDEQFSLLEFGLGVTNIVARASARAAELTAAELVAGAAVLECVVLRYAPRFVAMVGIGAYRTGFARPAAVVGPQPETLAGARLWVLPSTSGLNAHYRLDGLVAEFSALAAAVREGDGDRDAELRSQGGAAQ